MFNRRRPARREASAASRLAGRTRRRPHPCHSPRSTRGGRNARTPMPTLVSAIRTHPRTPTAMSALTRLAASQPVFWGFPDLPGPEPGRWPSRISAGSRPRRAFRRSFCWLCDLPGRRSSGWRAADRRGADGRCGRLGKRFSSGDAGFRLGLNPCEAYVGLDRSSESISAFLLPASPFCSSPS